MAPDIHHRLEDIKMVAQHNAKEHGCNYTVFQHAGDTYEMVVDSYWEKDRPYAKKLFLYDEDGDETDLQKEEKIRERRGKRAFNTLMGMSLAVGVNPVEEMEKAIEKHSQGFKGEGIVPDEEQDEWQSLETTPFDSPRVQSINCDTRDFHCSWRLEEREDHPHLSVIAKKEYDGKFFYTVQEIKEILLDLRERSGGEVKWRMLSFKKGSTTISDFWYFKYLRFYKCEYGWYCQPVRGGKIIRKDILKLPIDKENLSAH